MGREIVPAISVWTGKLSVDGDSLYDSYETFMASSVNVTGMVRVPALEEKG
jgi:hypothetical protein